MSRPTMERAALPVEPENMLASCQLSDGVDSVVALIGFRNDDPDYVEALVEGAVAARRAMDEEYLRMLDENENPTPEHI